MAKDMTKHKHDTIMVFTARSWERIIREGGSGNWKANPVHARQMNYVVCTQNQHHPDHDFSDATRAHGSGFLVTDLVAVLKAPKEDAHDRYRFACSKYALIDIPNLWDHGHNPVRYTSLEELAIDPDTLDWQPMPQSGDTPTTEVNLPDSTGANGATLTISAAKKALAATFGVRPEDIEITIRG